MPNIKEYTNQDVELHPTEAGYAAAMVSGRRIGGLMREGDAEIAKGLQNLYKPIGEVFKDMDQADTQKEISQGIVKRAQMEQGWSDQHNKIMQTTDPNDVRGALGQFTSSTVTPQAQSFMDSFKTPGGRQWASHAVSESIAQQMKRSAADGANASGDATMVNLAKTLNTRANTAYTTPSDIGHHLDAIDSDYRAAMATTPMPAHMRDKAQETVQHAKQTTAYQGGLGMLDQAADPTAAVGPYISQYGQYLSPAQQTELRNHADARAKVNAVKQRADETEVRRIEKDAFNQELNGIEADIYKTPGQIRVTPENWERAVKAANMPGASQEPGRVQSTLRFMRDELTNQQHGPLQTDTGIYQNFSGRMFLPASDPKALKIQDVYNERSNGHLNDHDFHYFKDGIDMAAKNPQLAADHKSFNSFITEYKKFFTNDSPFSGANDPEGHARFAQWQRDATEDMVARRAQGHDLRTIENDWAAPPKISRYLQGLADLNRQTQKMFDEKGQMRTDPLPPSTPINPIVKPWQKGQSADDVLKNNGH